MYQVITKKLHMLLLDNTLLGFWHLRWFDYRLVLSNSVVILEVHILVKKKKKK